MVEMQSYLLWVTNSIIYRKPNNLKLLIHCRLLTVINAFLVGEEDTMRQKATRPVTLSCWLYSCTEAGGLRNIPSSSILSFGCASSLLSFSDCALRNEIRSEDNSKGGSLSWWLIQTSCGLRLLFTNKLIGWIVIEEEDPSKWKTFITFIQDEGTMSI